MAGNTRKKERVTKYFDDDFDDFELNEIDITEILGPKKENYSKKPVVADKETEEESKEKNVDELIEQKGGLINFEIDEEKEKKPKEKSKRGRKKKQVEQNILEFVPKEFIEIEKELKEDDDEDIRTKERKKSKETLEQDFLDEEETLEKNEITAEIESTEEKPKRGRKKKTDIKENDFKAIKERKRKGFALRENDKEVKMEIDDESNLMTLFLKNKKCRLDIMPEEYNVYANNSKSYIIARQNKLNLVFEDSFLNICKNEKSYTVETDQDVKLDYIVCDIIKSVNKIVFTVENLSEILIDEKGLKLIIDETKVAENKVEDNNTLVISEEEGKVFLPYKKGEILQEIRRTKNTDINKIIENNYIKPMENYKNSIRARFKEGYKLMYEREGESRKKAFLLGLELMFEFNLHPAIISACRNLEELDIYLDCLEDNELEKFTCFKIIYKAMPVIRKRAKANMI